MNSLAGRVALVTGASGGFGQQFVETLTVNGASVVLTGRRTDVLDDVANRVGGKVVAADLNTVDVGTLFDRAEEAFGLPVSILINNAGIGHNDTALMCSGMTFRNVIEIDLILPFLLAQEAACRMKHGGSIVNICSTFGDRPTRGMVAYSMAKAALLQMTRCLALEWGASGIRVNALSPGWHETDMTRDYLATPRGRSILRDVPLGRFGQPDDLADALMVLVSGAYITGANLIVDGGLSLGMRDGGIAK